MLFSALRQKQHIAILGYNIEGQSSYRFLLSLGLLPKQITILDQKTDLILPVGAKHNCGPRYLDTLDQFDCIIRTPGITKTIIESKIKKSSDGLPFTSQTELFLSNYTGTIIGITGTKGKSTISTLAYLTLQDAGKSVILAGNIGKPVLDLIDRSAPPEMVVYELSSFMIESVFTHWTGRKINLAVFNTLYSTHTKEHGGYEQYARAKLLLLDHSEASLIGAQAASVINEQFPHLIRPDNTNIYGKTGTNSRHDGCFWQDKQPLFDDEGMLLIGEHNRENACAVIGLCRHFGIDLTHLQNTLHSFGGLEHRLEFVGIYGGIKRYNDAIATTPQTTCAALESFGSEVDTLFYGGIQGEYDHALVAEKIAKYGVKRLVLFPDTGEQLYDLLDAQTKKNITVCRTRSMHDAVIRAAQHTSPGKIALLSCGSPSFSVWSGFVEKGNLFKEAVRSL